ncbi:MAG TPA: efflux RND transporter periplasmic adaptor subunit [Candidatus Angelobacter sp.]|nr:efflux RND transporter periplasmic adaptor subunit [Candidatus Angelobacter sp.]
MTYKKLTRLSFALIALLMFLGLACGGCRDSKADPRAEAPPPANVEKEENTGVVSTDHPEQFVLASAIEHKSAPELSATGVVSPDITRNVSVISAASGRVVEIRARLGDSVKKGQILMRVQSADIAGAFADYRKAVADYKLAGIQFDRAKLLYDKGAISLNDYQTAEDVENKAKVDVENTTERLRVLGSTTLDHPTGIVDIHAPASGVITDQQVTNASGVQGLSAPVNPFTISDLSRVWIICDVYENNLSQIHLGDYADLRLNALPDKVLKGRIANIAPILDPTIRTAKVRLELENPGFLRVGMFVTAIFRGAKTETHTAVPATAILHLHDRQWVYVPAGNGKFKRIEVTVGGMLPDNMQEILSGLAPGTQVIQDALVFQNTTEQ